MEKARVAHLRVYPEIREVKSSVNGVIGKRAGALVLDEPIGDTNVIELSPAQLDDMCGLLQIQRNKVGWKQLAVLIGTGGRAMCSYTATPHKKGEKYTDKAGVEHEYTKDWNQIQVSSIILNSKVTDIFTAATAKAVVDSFSNFDFGDFGGADNAAPKAAEEA